MPTVTTPINAAYDNITRPIALAVVRGLLDQLELPNSRDVKLAGNINSLAQPGSLLSDTNPNRVPAQFPFTNRTFIDIEDRIVDADTLTYAGVRSNDSSPIFVDRALDVVMQPINTEYEMVVSVQYRAPSQNQAQRWRNQLIDKAARGRQAMLFTATFHYEIPRAFQAILANIYELRENKAGYGEDLRTYLKAHMSDQVSVVTTVAGGKKELHVTQRLVRIQGSVDFIDVPDQPEADDQGNAYTTGFTFTFRYSRPTNVKFQYPIVIHNQPLPAELIPTVTVTNEDFYLQTHDQLNRLYRSYEQQGHYQKGVDEIIDPPYDDWSPTTHDPYLVALYTTAILRSDEDPRWAFDLVNIPDWNLNQVIEDFLVDERTYLNVSRLSPFTVTVFEDDIPLRPDLVWVDEQLKVHTTFDLHPRKRYHGRLSLCRHLGILTDEAIDRLRRYPEVFHRILVLLGRRPPVDGGYGGGGQENTDPHRGQPHYDDGLVVIGDPDNGGQVTRESARREIDDQWRANTPSEGRRRHPMWTVAQFTLFAYPKGDYRAKLL